MTAATSGATAASTAAATSAAATSAATARNHVVVVGASLAGLRAAEALRRGGFGGELSVVGEEVHRPYDRPPLSKAVLCGDCGPEKTHLPGSLEVDAHWLLGRRAIGLDLSAREVSLDDDTRIGFDGLLIATGSRPRPLPALRAQPDRRVRGVHVLRTLDDSLALRAALRRHPHQVAVIGAGFIGTEVAAAARTVGAEVTLIDAAPVPLLSAVGFSVGQYVADLHRRHGVQLRLGAYVANLETHEHVLTAVRLDDGTAVEADLAVAGLGTVPNTDWLARSQVLLDNGVRTDASLRVLGLDHQPLDGVVAAGDVVRWPHPLFDDELVRIEHWSNAADHARVAAATLLDHLSGRDDETAPRRFAGVPSFWSDQYDTKLMSVGLPHLGQDSAVLDGTLPGSGQRRPRRHPRRGQFTVGFGRHGRMVGAVASNQPRRLALYRRHIANRGSWPPPSTEVSGDFTPIATRH